MTSATYCDTSHTTDSAIAYEKLYGGTDLSTHAAWYGMVYVVVSDSANAVTHITLQPMLPSVLYFMQQHRLHFVV